MSSHNSNDSYGKFGMLLFALSFIVTIIFFIYIVVINPGGVDSGVFTVPVMFSKAQADARTLSWKELSAENTAYGEQLYKVNCNFCHSQSGKDVILERLTSGNLKFGKTPLGLYRTIRKGFEGQHRFDFIPEQGKWMLVDFLRSKMTNPPDDSSGEMKNFLKEGMY